MSDPYNDDAPRPQIVGDGWTVRAGLDSREKTALRALQDGIDVQDELVGEGKGIGSQFRAYIEHVTEEAFAALVHLAKVIPDDKDTIFDLQKRIAPYNSVMDWVGKVIEEADQAAKEIEATEEVRDVAHGLAAGGE